MTVTTSRLEQLLERIPKATAEQEHRAALACIAAEGYQDTPALRETLEMLGLLGYAPGKWRRR